MIQSFREFLNEDNASGIQELNEGNKYDKFPEEIQKVLHFLDIECELFKNKARNALNYFDISELYSKNTDILWYACMLSVIKKLHNEIVYKNLKYSDMLLFLQKQSIKQDNTVDLAYNGLIEILHSKKLIKYR